MELRFDQVRERQRVGLHIAECRETVFDRLARIILVQESSHTVDIPRIVDERHPVDMIQSLDATQRKLLADAAQVWIDMKDHVAFWTAVLDVCAQCSDTVPYHHHVQDDLSEVLHDKTVEELDTIQKDVTKIIENGPCGIAEMVDAAYWKAVASSLRLEMASRLLGRVWKAAIATGASKQPIGPLTVPHHTKPRRVSKDHALWEQERERGLRHDEAEFNHDVPLPSPLTQWNPVKGQTPRPPLYYNRSIMGIEWNDYNLAHYSKEDPPPPQILGFRFCIIYADLEDPTQIPQYRILSDPDSAPQSGPETVLLRFEASAPYHDIGFRIPDRQWETHSRQGFVSKFEHGILYLTFRFKQTVQRR